jgi:hypothetical protein
MVYAFLDNLSHMLFVWLKVIYSILKGLENSNLLKLL